MQNRSGADSALDGLFLDASSKPAPDPDAVRLRRRVTIGVCAVSACGIVGALWPFVAPGFRKRALPYLPASPKQMANVFAMLNVNGYATSKASEPLRLVDLGSGDGRVVLHAAKSLYHAHGVDLNWTLVAKSKMKASQLGMGKLPYPPTFAKQDLFKHPIDQYDVVVFFGADGLMNDLETKLSKELSPTACAVTCRFPLPTWRPHDSMSDGVDSVWLYRRQ